MNRLTEWTGERWIANQLKIGIGDKAIYAKLAAYEDTGLEPEQVKQLNDAFTNSQKKLEKAFDDLLEYKKLEEQGLLIKLPCKVGDTVYKIEDYGEWMDNKVFMPIKCKVELIFIGNDNKVYCDLKNIDEIFGIGEELFEEIPIKNIYLTKEEAEKALNKEENK